MRLKKEGKGLLKINPQMYDAFVDLLEEGEEVEATLMRIKDIRNLPQNRLYWRILTTISDEYGDVNIGKYKWHEYFKNKYLCHTEVILGEEIMVCQSTADLTKKAFSEYIQKIEAWAAHNMGISVMTADDKKLL